MVDRVNELNGDDHKALTPRTVSRSDSKLAPPAPLSTATPAQADSSLPASDGLDPEGLRAYRLALARQAGGHKRYPAEAVEAGWAGIVMLRVLVRTGGVAGSVALVKSSGHNVLDDAALEIFGQAVLATPLPPALRERAFELILPVLFELPD
jgi:periplasmic protein TonB